MSYQVLARKWRPQSFSDVVGQEHVLAALENSLSLGRLHHAYLFSGTRGVGKTTLARLLAKGLSCESGITAKPCGHCGNCVDIAQGRFVDLLEVDAASRTKVEDTRDLLENTQYAPARGRFKIYLIDEVHMLSRHSFNALLKTLEEPPEHVKFLLATTDPQKLPLTILSRCLQFHLKALDFIEIREHLSAVLQKEDVEAEPKALQLLARAANGSLRDALSLTDQAIASGRGSVTEEVVANMLGTLVDDQALTLIESFIAGDGKQTMLLVQHAAKKGVEWESLLMEILRLLHHIALLQLLPSMADDIYTLSQQQRLLSLARATSPTDIQLYYKIFLIGREELPLAPNRRMGVEMTLLRALAFRPKTPDEIGQRSPELHDILLSPEKKVIGEPHNIAARSQLPSTTKALLDARHSLLEKQEAPGEIKKREPAVSSLSVQQGKETHQLLSQVKDRNFQTKAHDLQETEASQEPYQWKTRSGAERVDAPMLTPATLRASLEYEKTPELIESLIKASHEKDPWAAEIPMLALTKRVEQLALNSWKEQNDQAICLHFRASHRHLNSVSARKALEVALSKTNGKMVELSLIEDNNPEVLTPVEWRQKIYEEKLTQARQSIAEDKHIQALCRLFDAKLDEKSIRPI